ncbi:MAG: mannose-1-phosphate guanylyltransferase/mannose-6-phosphate isomerase [Candidatus Sulfobium sp.]
MYAVILAGGSGTRFWPLSREKTPKQLLRVFGESTMIQQTVERLHDSLPVENVYIVTGEKYAYDIRNQLMEVCGSDKFRMIIEPVARNTAPAVGLAAAYISRKSPKAVMAVMPSDHIILKEAKFTEVLKKASETASKGYLTTIGIIPDRAETGYGYIKKGKSLGAGGKGRGKAGEKKADPDGAAFSVERFVEKPDLKKASEYVKSGDYLWNSGIFVWRVCDILEEMKKQLPGLYGGIMKIGMAIGKKNEQAVLEEVFAKLEPVSIDYGIMEHAGKVAVVPADINWSDVGSWRALDDIAKKDVSGNIITGNVIDVGSKNSIIYAGKRLIATVGLDNTVVVDTPDATLICDKDRTQDVRQVVDELKKKGAEELIEHVTVHRPWGSYILLEAGSRYKIKRIVVKPGAKLSHQLHHHRSEHWVVVSGTARVTVGDKSYHVHPNESTYVPISTKHRLENPGKVPLHLIEVQNGDYIEEDDIVRFDDEYGRGQ